MKQKLTELSSSSFVRNVVIIASGTAGAQVIGMAFSPLITRLYGPDAFGLLGTFMAILAIVAPIAALTYPIAIVLPKSDVDAINLAKLSASLALAMATVVALILLLTKNWVTDLFNLEAIGGFLLLIPLVMLFSAFQQILEQCLIRKKQFKITARVSVVQALIISTTKASIGWFYPVGAVLIILLTISGVLNVVLLLLGIRRSASYVASQKTVSNDRKIDSQISTLKALAKQYKDFPLYRAPQVLINAFSQSLPVLILASLFSPASAGFYALGNMVMSTPITLIGKSVGDVFYPRITEAVHNREDIFHLILKATLALAVIGFIPFALVTAFGPWLFSFVFGAEWITAGEYARWLAMWLFCGFLNKPSVATIPAIGEQHWLFYYELFSTSTKIIALIIGFYYFRSDIVAIALFCIVGIIAYIYLILRTLFKAKRYTYAKAS